MQGGLLFVFFSSIDKPRFDILVVEADFLRRRWLEASVYAVRYLCRSETSRSAGLMVMAEDSAQGDVSCVINQ